MPRFKVTFHKCIQNSQDYGSNDQHMVSRVFFSLGVDQKQVGDYSADLKQAVGDDFETGAIEVGPPQGYQGPFDHAGFADAAAKYFRSLVGASASGIRIVGGASIKMRNNVFQKDAVFEF